MSTSLQEKAYQIIKNKIIYGKLCPGEFLNETVLSNELEISRTPIRAALQNLTNEGLVRSIPTRGCFVTKFSMKEIGELIEVREVLECKAITNACHRITEHDLDKYEIQFKKLIQNDANILIEALVSADIDFHKFIARSAGNQLLFNILASLYDKSVMVHTLSCNIPERLNQSWEEHLQTISAIKERDVEKAKESVHYHLLKTKNVLGKAMYGSLAITPRSQKTNVQKVFDKI